MVLLHGAAAWCHCMMPLLLPLLLLPLLLLPLLLLLLVPLLLLLLLVPLLLLLLHAASSGSSSNFLIYKIAVAVEAASAIFGRYLVTQWRQLLVAADAFRAEHWVQFRR